MNRLTKIFLGLLVATSILALTYPAIAKRSTAASVKNSIGLEISLDGRKPFTLSLSAKNQRLAVLPVNEAKTSAIKVISRMEGGSIKFDLLAVLDKLPEVPTCDNIKELKTEPVSSYVAREGDVIRVSDFEKFGVAPFTVRAIRPDVEAACPDGWCCCGKIKCFPNPDFCIECSSCGLCCG